ncbi:MAG: FHA domain-containing protein [Chloroflexi bacterium]|nr:FHA domain-containing protein [Chloroflexota bacterium]
MPWKSLIRFEHLLQRSVEQPFTRLVGGKLQPVEVAHFLARELVINKRVGINRVYAPNWFRAQLSSKDYQQFFPFLDELRLEIARYLEQEAQRRNFIFLGQLEITLEEDPQLKAGEVLAEAAIHEHMPAGSPSSLNQPTPPPATSSASTLPSTPPGTPGSQHPFTIVLRDRGKAVQRVSVNQGDVRVGREYDNDMVIEHPQISRHHARFFWDGDLFVEDVGSRNGTFVNGERIVRSRLTPGDHITLGPVELVIEQ